MEIQKMCLCKDEKEWHAYKYDTVTYWGRDEWSQMKSNHVELKMFKLDLQKDGRDLNIIISFLECSVI